MVNMEGIQIDVTTKLIAENQRMEKEIKHLKKELKEKEYLLKKMKKQMNVYNDEDIERMEFRCDHI